GKNSLNRLIRCVCGKKIGPDPRNFNQRVSLGRNDLLIRTFLRDCVYTRYSDDITISGDNRHLIEELVSLAKNKINNMGFTLNNAKYRLLSYNNRQAVTGILINGPLRPPRAYRRRVRAIFDQAIKSNDQTSLTINALKGHLNYLQSFKKYGFSFEETKYSLIIEKLTKK
ncbi:hypothetical protein NEO04_22690, partial [Enterobacter hormaechei]|nr:hypothetical protein [Enterobacter hormaechei]